MKDYELGYEEAFIRLVNEKPKNKELKKKLISGKLRINVRNVAIEAGQSRTALAISNTKYLRIRKLIDAHNNKKFKDKVKSPASISPLKVLQEENASLKIQLGKVLSENANLIKEKYDITVEINKINKRNERLANSQPSSNTKVVSFVKR